LNNLPGPEFPYFSIAHILKGYNISVAPHRDRLNGSPTSNAFFQQGNIDRGFLLHNFGVKSGRNQMSSSVRPLAVIIQ
jgi:hypothetical protein